MAFERDPKIRTVRDYLIDIIAQIFSTVWAAKGDCRKRPDARRTEFFDCDLHERPLPSILLNPFATIIFVKTGPRKQGTKFPFFMQQMCKRERPWMAQLSKGELPFGDKAPAPKARSIPAWGNAPGLRRFRDQGLKARPVVEWIGLSALEF